MIISQMTFRSKKKFKKNQFPVKPCDRIYNLSPNRLRSLGSFKKNRKLFFFYSKMYAINACQIPSNLDRFLLTGKRLQEFYLAHFSQDIWQSKYLNANTWIADVQQIERTRRMLLTKQTTNWILVFHLKRKSPKKQSVWNPKKIWPFWKWRNSKINLVFFTKKNC